MKPHITILNVMAWFTLISAAVLITLFGYWTLYPYEPLTVHKAEVLTPTVAQGDTLALRLTYTKTMPLPGLGVRTFVDGIIFSTSAAQGNIPVGEKLVILRDVPIPTTLPAGVYHIHSRVVFEVNPIRDVTYEYDTPTFTVTPRR